MKEFIEKGNYRLDKEGIFVPEYNCIISTKFSDNEQDDLFETEDTSWWFQYRAQIIVSLFLKYCNIHHTVLDIGGGNGYTSSILRQSGGEVGIIEPSYGACLNAKKRTIEYVICDSINENSPKCTIKQALLLDVLEHIESPGIFLKNLYSVMTNSGHIIVTVPAFMSLWSSEDEHAGHLKRYRVNELREEMEEAGFEIQYVSYFMKFLYIPILLGRTWGEKLRIIKKSQYRTDEERKKIMEQQFKSRGGIVNIILTCLEKNEMRKIFSGKCIKFGSSIVLIGIKR